MKEKFFPLLVAFLTVLIFSTGSISRGNLITFDDLLTGTNADGTRVISVVPADYGGLDWDNFFTLSGPAQARVFGTNGSYYGMVSASNVAFNGSGTPAEIDSAGTDFNFVSTYLTGAWNSNLNIEVEGFRSGTLLYDTTVVASATSPTLFTFNYTNIDQLVFNSFGGQPAGFPNGGGESFVMDNFTFEFIPEPSSLPLATVGALLLWPLLKRKRV